MRIGTLARDSDNMIELTQFHDRVNDSYPTTAVATVTLQDPDGADVDDAIDIPVTRVGTTTGIDTLYRGILPASVELLPRTTYTAILTVSANGGQRTFFTECRVLE